jgi:hypothetical protein
MSQHSENPRYAPRRATERTGGRKQLRIQWFCSLTTPQIPEQPYGYLQAKEGEPTQ